MASKSYIIALGLLEGHLTADTAAQAAHVEVQSQIDRWGEVEDSKYGYTYLSELRSHFLSFQSSRCRLSRCSSKTGVSSPDDEPNLAAERFRGSVMSIVQ